MGRMRAATLLAAVTGGPLAVLLILRAIRGAGPSFDSPMLHLSVVGAISGCALLIAILSSMAAVRVRQPALTLLALGCLLVSTLMLAHALTTPGLSGVPDNLWKRRLPYVAMGSFSVLLVVAVGRPRTATKRLVGRFPRVLPIGAAILLVAVASGIVAWPDAWIGNRAVPGEAYWLRGVALSGAGLFAVSAIVHWRRWRLGHNRVLAALFAASVLSAQALIALAFAPAAGLAWWDYHVYIVAGFAAVIYTVVVEYRHIRVAGDALATIFAHDPWDHISTEYPDVLRALVKAVEAKDGYTHGHSARVAELAVRIGQRLRLSPKSLRELAQGALLHDIGKIGVPDAILNKPGMLSDDERLWVEQHPIIGWETVREVASLAHALHPIRHHHERFDGTGYPDGLAGEDIPLSARITAVADVWDALTSDRAYRQAWSLQEALAHIAAGRGSHFDPHCVDAFLELMAERDISLPPASGSILELAQAAEGCHTHPAELRSYARADKPTA
jgi:HD-GYP domain-containing protein (c-di-GMP phosphodiesterase class II)